MDSKFKSVEDYAFLYASYSPDIKTIGAGYTQESDYKSSRCSSAPAGSIKDREFMPDKDGKLKVVTAGGEGSSAYMKAEAMFEGQTFGPPCGGDYVVSSDFGPRSSSVGSSDHKGMDIAPRGPNGERLPAGTVPAQVPADGKIVSAKVNPGGYGNYVDVQHTAPDGSTYVTRYGHLDSKGFNELKADLALNGPKVVKAGDPVGWIGNTGASSGPHLHFEVRVEGVPVDPRVLWR